MNTFNVRNCLVQTKAAISPQKICILSYHHSDNRKSQFVYLFHSSQILIAHIKYWSAYMFLTAPEAAKSGVAVVLWLVQETVSTPRSTRGAISPTGIRRSGTSGSGHAPVECQGENSGCVVPLTYKEQCPEVIWASASAPSGRPYCSQRKRPLHCLD